MGRTEWPENTTQALEGNSCGIQVSIPTSGGGKGVNYPSRIRGIGTRVNRWKRSSSYLPAALSPAICKHDCRDLGLFCISIPVTGQWLHGS